MSKVFGMTLLFIVARLSYIKSITFDSISPS